MIFVLSVLAVLPRVSREHQLGLIRGVFASIVFLTYSWSVVDSSVMSFPHLRIPNSDVIGTNRMFSSNSDRVFIRTSLEKNPKPSVFTLRNPVLDSLGVSYQPTASPSSPSSPPLHFQRAHRTSGLGLRRCVSRLEEARLSSGVC